VFGEVCSDTVVVVGEVGVDSAVLDTVSARLMFSFFVVSLSVGSFSPDFVVGGECSLMLVLVDSNF
jgi:hypothetical protein